LPGRKPETQDVVKIDFLPYKILTFQTNADTIGAHAGQEEYGLPETKTTK